MSYVIINMKVLAVTLLAVISVSQGRSLGVGNGTIEEPHGNPWQVKLYLGTHQSLWPCGGTLISSNYVLTAARCLSFHDTNKASGLYIYLGYWDISVSRPNGTLRLETSVDAIKVHEGYNATTHVNDIALIELPQSVNFSDKIQPARLASEADVEIGQVAHISGWMYPYREWQSTHQYLHGGNVTIVNNSVCLEEYPSYVIDEKVLCASGTVAMCYGDEGAAMLINGKTVGIAYGSRPVLVPLEECPIVPNTYLYVAKYLEWIKANSDYQE